MRFECKQAVLQESTFIHNIAIKSGMKVSVGANRFRLPTRKELPGKPGLWQHKQWRWVVLEAR
jgi:hypothetical protein